MKKFFSIHFILFMVFGFVGCSPKPPLSTSNAETAEYHKISAEEAKKMIDENPDALLLDVRTTDEYKEKHIDGALLIPDYDIEAQAATQLPDKTATILIYCRSGNRSQGAAQKLVSMGYTHVYDFGGIGNWTYGTVSE